MRVSCRLQVSRAVCAWLLVVVWLMASNRCGLAAMLQHDYAQTVQMGCCGKSDSGHSVPMPLPECCCKALNAIAADSEVFSKAPVIELGIVLVPAVELQKSQVRFGIHTMNGPPKGASFAELVLNRSLLSHAPPVSPVA